MMGGGANTPTVDVKRYNADRELTRLTKKYKLTAEQKAKIQPLLAEQEKKVHTLGEDESLSDTDWVASVRQVHRQTVIKVKEEMTDAQAAKYVADEEKQAKDDAEQDQMPNGPPPGGGGPPPGGGGPPGI
jgi:hypothetical protein